MQRFRVMCPTPEELEKIKENPTYMATGVLHCSLEAVNESVARTTHRRDMIDGKYPHHSWVEVDETDSSVLAAR